MKPYLVLLSITATALAVPIGAADHGDICVDEAGVCADPEACFALTQTCLDPNHPKEGIVALWEWVKDLFGPCTCPPQDVWD